MKKNFDNNLKINVEIETITEMDNYQHKNFIEYSHDLNRLVRKEILVDKRNNNDIYKEIIKELDGTLIEIKEEPESDHKATTDLLCKVNEINYDVKFTFKDFTNLILAFKMNKELYGLLDYEKWQKKPKELIKHIRQHLNKNYESFGRQFRKSAEKGKTKLTVFKYYIEESIDFKEHVICISIIEKKENIDIPKNFINAYKK
jgi:hypothetical protein